MMRSIRYWVAALAVVHVCFNSALVCEGASKPEDEFNSYMNKYPGEAAIYTLRKQQVNYKLVGDSIVTTITVYEEMLHLGENTQRYAADKVYSSAFFEVSDLKAYTLVPQKRKFERFDVSDFKESHGASSSVFYDDTKEIGFTFPSVQKGVKTIVEYTNTVKDPRMIGMFFFNTYLPVDKAVYQVVYDDNVMIAPRLNNVKGLEIKEEKSRISDSQTMLTYTCEGIDKIKFDSDCPSYSYLGASIYSPVAVVTKTNGEKEYVISSTERLHAWYRTFIDDLQDHDPDVKALVNTIVKPSDTDIDKVKKIYNWVQSNIKYIAFEDGMRGLIPHPANYVIDKRYGDCKDMASTLVSMLREANVEAYFTWVGTRDLPYKYSEIPSPIADNHMIATVVLDGKTYFLDATGQYLPLGLPSSMIQGKECLVSLNDSEFRIQKVPVVPKEVNVMTDSVTISLDNGTIHGNAKIGFSGYAKFYNTFKLIKSNQKSVDNYLERLLTKGSNKFHLDDYSISDLSNRYKPLTIDYKFTIPDYYREIGDNIYINLVLDRTMSDALLENRYVALENDYKYINRSVINLQIPEGYQLKELPDAIEDNNELFGFRLSYDSTDDQVIVTREFYVDYLVMETESFQSWNDIISAYASACRKAMIFSKQ